MSWQHAESQFQRRVIKVIKIHIDAVFNLTWIELNKLFYIK